MGEVYRAQDLKLGEDVALKFLPPLADAGARTRLSEEVRLGRKIAHPSVCRIYDVAEVDGHHFITMQYVDGEDLASLLRRIGRIPDRKALDLTRDICAGLAAAHEQGIVHRDLKPANIMVDGLGRARIMDFGVAALIEDLREERGVVAGTPAYMAPEQFSGTGLTAQTDLYALGLVLYELFTGQRFVKGETPKEIRTAQASTPAAPITFPPGLDSSVAGIITSCLRNDPVKRPASARAILEVLPGGDQLEAAVIAGETPSPEMVAAAQVLGTVKRWVAWACLILTFGGILVAVLLVTRTRVECLVPLQKSPVVLTDKAREIIREVMNKAPRRDSAGWFVSDGDYMSFAAKQDGTPSWWQSMAEVRPGPALFIYRQSPLPLLARNSRGEVLFNDPPFDEPGMITLILDRTGRLVTFLTVSSTYCDSGGSVHPPEWNALFETAGLEAAELQLVHPEWAPSVAADLRQAWIGSFPEQPSVPIRIEAGSLTGSPTYFRIVGPWYRPQTFEERSPDLLEVTIDSTWLMLYGLVLGGAGWVAFRNHRFGRGDRQGSARVGAFIFFLLVFDWVFAANHTYSPLDELYLFANGAGRALFWTVFCWLCYFAVEPYVRRQWPHVLIAWKRLLQGRVRDPLVGRDLLIGMLGGAIVFTVREWVFMPSSYYWVPLSRISSLGDTLAEHLRGEFWAAQGAFLGLLVLFIARLLLRRDWLAWLVAWAVSVVAFMPHERLTLALPAMILIMGVHLLMLYRFGFLALFVMTSTNNFFEASVLTLDPNAWFFGRSMVSILCLTGIATYAFRTTLGDKPAIGGLLLEDT
jgi:serine/threonine-protein kinase